MNKLTTTVYELDEVRVITLPPPQTAAVNRLLREEKGWCVLDARVTERKVLGPQGLETEQLVVYVMGHRGPGATNASG
jgi:hypothetical protein